MKSFILFLIMAISAVNFSYAQDGNYINLTTQTFTKGVGATDYSGWGTSPNSTLDPRPNSPDGRAFIMNSHYGLTFTAHSLYGGIRFYNQSYPGGPLDPLNGANLAMSITDNNVGVGTATPLTKLHVYQNVADQAGLIIQGNTIKADAVPHYVALTFDGDYGNATGNFSQIRSYSNLYSSWGSELAFFTTQWGVANKQVERLRIDKYGNVGIGTSSPQEALSVNGNIRSKQIKVETDNWPDYVFKKDYQLPSLAEVKTYIDKNQRLPEVPSEQEIAKDGLNLGEMNKLLLKKVEELTLYMIEKDEEKKQQNEKLNSLQGQVNKLTLQLEKILAINK